MKTIMSLLLVSSFLMSESLEESLLGFDDEPVKGIKTLDKHDDLMLGFEEEIRGTSNQVFDKKTKSSLEGISGKLTEQIAFSYSQDDPHDNVSSLKSSFLLDYEHRFENGFKFKANLKSYYDAIYTLRGREKYTQDELNELQSELELYDAYIEGSLSNDLDIKVGRQVVVWGRSDTIRITDVLNPLDNRRPGLVDIEDLRLPIGMLKLDYFSGDWRITPMVIFEQRFSKNPPSGSAFNPINSEVIDDKSYTDFTSALSLGAEFSSWDINLYMARIRDDNGYVSAGLRQHDRVTMFGTALNILKASWLFKGEFAQFNGLKYRNSQESFKRNDFLFGIEYNGLSDTLISYDTSLRKIENFDNTLSSSPLFLEDKTYQHAFRISSDFMNATLQANYLISLFGRSFDEGGFQRLWFNYDLSDSMNVNVGLVDYIGGTARFDLTSNNDMFFTDISYNF